MNIYTIYKATNLINNKVYIGFDSKFPSRVYSHKCYSKTSDHKFYRAIRKHGFVNFKWEIIFQSLERDYTLKIMEPYFIKENNSFKCGYNSTIGGEGTFGRIMTNEQKEKHSKYITESNTGSKWFNNSVINKFQKEHPGEGWILGRLNQKPSTLGNKWYNNGTQQICSKTKPDGWVRGMLPK
jgi:group I intron endonuclease